MEKAKLLLLDEGWVTTLPVAAGLSGVGYTVHIISADGIDPDPKYLIAYASQQQAPSISTSEYMEVIDKAAGTQEFISVLPMTEPVIYRLWDSAPSWSGKIYPATEEWQRALLRNKRLMSEFVAKFGVNIPAFCRIGSSDDVLTTIRTLGLPLVVKGVTGLGGTNVRIAETESAVLDSLRALTTTSEESPTLQRYIDGPTFLVGGLFHEGKALRLYAAEKTEMYPPHTGPSIRLRSHRDEDLIEQALTVFRELRWNGLASVDFMRDAEGRYYFLEMNPRTWGAIAAARSAGVDIFKPLGALLRGKVPAADLTFRTGIRSTLFPEYLQTRIKQGGPRGLITLLRNVGGWRDIPWWYPGIAMHMVRRIYWDWQSLSRPPK